MIPVYFERGKVSRVVLVPLEIREPLNSTHLGAIVQIGGRPSNMLHICSEVASTICCALTFTATALCGQPELRERLVQH